MKPVLIATPCVPRCKVWFHYRPLTTADPLLWASKFGRLIFDCFWAQWRLML